MSLAVLAFPILNKKDLQWIQAYRKENDDRYDVIDPHFTLVFPIADEPLKNFLQEIEKQSNSIQSIEFEITKAIVIKDAFSDDFHEFLIPEKGYHEIVALHDKLYEKKLQPFLRRDIEYIPHITIGNSKSHSKCLETVNQLNSEQLSIKGNITELTVIDYTNNRLSIIKKIDLR